MLASSDGDRKRMAPEGREMTHSPPPPLNQEGASSSMPHAPPQPLKHNNDVASETLEEMRKQQYATVGEASKKLMKKYEEMEEVAAMIASYTTQALTMAERLKALEKTNAALNAALHQSGDAAVGQVAVVRISCKRCLRGPATVMAWPCRHLCLCNNCARTANRCPICPATLQDCIEVKFY